jgi:ABC-type transporter Mla MlaB component
VAGCEHPPTPLRVLSTREPGTLVLAVVAPVTRAHVPRLCAGVRSLLEASGADRLVYDVGALGDPDAATVDALARLRLTARRLHCEVRLRNASPRLRELLALVGLSDVLPCCPASGLDGQPEHGEQVRRVQERVDPGDATG